MITWEEFAAIHAAMPESQPISYRLYHDDQGRPIVYTMEHLPGNYIEIDRETYVAGSPWVRVIDGKLRHLIMHPRQKLRPGDTGTSCHPLDVAVVDPSSGVFWSKHTYDIQED